MNEKTMYYIGVAVFAAVFVLVALLRERMKNRQPIMEIEAEVLSKRVVTRAHKSTHGFANGHYYHVTFQTADGSVVELATPEGSGRYEEGTKGILIYQGEKCEKFTPYE